MNVRQGTYDDLKECAEFSRRFWNQLDFSKKIPFVLQDVEDMFCMCLTQNLVAVAIEDEKIVGLIAGLASPCIANFNFRFGAELIWYVDKKYRKTGVGPQLLQQIEKQAKDAGLVRWSMVSFDQLESEAVEFVLESQGYTLTERVYAKVL